MILWTVITSGLLYGIMYGEKELTRRNCSIILVVWLLFSLALYLTGGNVTPD